MSMEAEWVPFGRAALDRLAEVVTEAKDDDPLAPVIVVVPTNPVGVYARRALGSRPGGVANVEFTTVERLAHDVAGPILAASGSSPLSDQIRAAAVRAELDRDARSLAAVRHHASTDRAVADALATIHRSEAGGVLGEGGRELARDVVAIGRGVDRRTAGHHDETDLVSLAAGRAPAGAPVVLFLPEWLFPAQRRLVAAIAERVSVCALLGATGVTTIDAVTVELARKLGVETTSPTFEAPAPTEVRSVSDADDEARHAVRWLLARREEGVPFHRMAILYTAADPYRRALHRHLEAAGITSNGPSMVTVGETIVGRVVTRLLDLVGSPLRRDEVMAFVESGPLRSPDDVVIRPTIWDEHSRKAGVVRGLEQWTSRLGEHRDELSSRDDDPDGWSARQAAQCDDLLRFVVTLFADLDGKPEPGTWRELVEWLKALIVRYVPGPAGRASWPELEQESVERLDLTLDLLAGLDDIEPVPSWESFRAAINVELSRTTRRFGRLGEGVLVGPLSSGIGATFDAVAVVGAIEGLAPRRVRHGVILGPLEHERVGRDLGGDSTEGQHRRYLAALAAGEGPRLVTWSRGDLRQGRLQYPSRWLEDVAAADVLEVPSYAAALATSTDPAANASEWDLRRLAPLDDVAAHSSPVVAAEPVLRVGGGAIAARRWGRRLTEWSGRVEPADVEHVLEGVLSATSLERFAACGYQFFLGNVLGLRRRDDPEDRIDIDPRDRGNVVHRILQRLVDERIAAGVAVLPDDAARLRSIAEEELAEIERHGLTADPLHWEMEREAIGVRLEDFVVLDTELREQGAVPLATELAFGIDHRPPVELSTGRHSVRLRGFADRVDQLPDGSVVVVDYKTANKPPQRKRMEERAAQGRALQLPVYALAALARHPGPGATAAYWYLAAVGGPTLFEVDLETAEDQVREAVDVFAELIESGRFPTSPGQPDTWKQPTFTNCRYCDFAEVCPADRDELADRQSLDPTMVRYVELTTREAQPS
jgi:RecB family exonuclease